jgi:uncharacterized protein (DUF302 family)
MADMSDKEYAMVLELQVPPAQAVASVREAFGAAGFGILYELDMRQTFKDKLGKDFRFYTILGICDPHLAYHGLQVQPDMGLTIPCNVVVQEVEGRGVVVKAVRATQSWRLLGSSDLVAVGQEAEDRIREVLGRLGK